MLGIDINEIRTVKIEDAEFQVGIIPYGIRLKLDAVTARFKDDDKTIIDNYDEFLLRNMGYLKYGIKGHKGIKDKAGKEIPFKSAKETHGGREVSAVDDEVLDMYLVMGLAEQLIPEIFKANTVSKEEEKNS